MFILFSSIELFNSSTLSESKVYKVCRRRRGDPAGGAVCGPQAAHGEVPGRVSAGGGRLRSGGDGADGPAAAGAGGAVQRGGGGNDGVTG